MWLQLESSASESSTLHYSQEIKPHPIDGQYFSKFRAAGTLHHFVEPECGFVSFTNLHTWTKRLQNMVTGNESVKVCDIAYDLQKWCPISIRDLILLWKFGPPMHLLPARSTAIWDTNIVNIILRKGAIGFVAHIQSFELAAWINEWHNGRVFSNLWNDCWNFACGAWQQFMMRCNMGWPPTPQDSTVSHSIVTIVVRDQCFFIQCQSYKQEIFFVGLSWQTCICFDELIVMVIFM